MSIPLERRIAIAQGALMRWGRECDRTSEAIQAFRRIQRRDWLDEAYEAHAASIGNWVELRAHVRGLVEQLEAERRS